MRALLPLRALSPLLLATAILLSPYTLSAQPQPQPQPQPTQPNPTPPVTPPVTPPASPTAATLHDADLTGRHFIHSGTFANTSRGAWARDDVELEGLYGLEGVDGRRLYDVLRAAPGPNGRPVRGSLFDDDNNFRAMRRNPLSEAFTAGFPIDEIPWDAERHAVREASPHVWTTIESDRYEVDSRRGRRTLSVGTDVMDDVYYDTGDFTLMKNHMTVRGRRRWDDNTTIRRILVGAKIDGEMDEFGLKRAAKIDVRNDGADAAEIAGLDDAVMTGVAKWNSSDSPLAPVKRIHEKLAARGALPSTESYKDVLLLEPKAVLRSVRSRYHLNEAGIDDVKRFHELGADRLTRLAATAKELREGGSIPADRADAVKAFEAKVAGTLDRTLVAERAAAKLRELDPTMNVTAATVEPLMPGASPLPPATDLDDLIAREPDLKKRRVVAETVSDLYHELARDLDDGSDRSLRRLLTRSEERALEPHAKWFVDWEKSKDAKLAPLTTYDRFSDLHRTLSALPDAERAAALAEYNAFGKMQKDSGVRGFRDWQPLDDAAFKQVGAQLDNEKLRIWGRQLESAGTAGRGLWFDQAREFYVPESNRAYGNFLIDTMDFTAMYTPDAWAGVPPAERTLAKGLPEDKLIGAKLVNELQIELGSEEAYVNRLDDLKHGAERARGLMRWASATNHPALGGGADAAAYAKLHAALRGMNETELSGELTRANAWLAANGGAGAGAGATGGGLAPDTLPRIPTSLFTPAIRDGGTDPRVDSALAGARFVFEQYRDFSTYASRIKGDRVMSILREAGVTEPMTWEVPKTSKGEAALGLVAASSGVDLGGPGVIDALNGGARRPRPPR